MAFNTYNAICTSIENGQHEQAREQMSKLSKKQLLDFIWFMHEYSGKDLHTILHEIHTHMR